MKPNFDERGTLMRLKLLPVLFRKEDVEKVAPHSAIYLSRAQKKGLIHRLIRGIYINSFLYGFPRVEEVACFARPPAYVTCEWALNYHGITPQSPVVCTAATLGPAVGKRHTIDYQGITIEFSRISPVLFFGFTRIDEFSMATPEKALLDTLHLRRALPTPDELEMESVDIDSLREMSFKFPGSVRKRLDSFLHRLSIPHAFSNSSAGVLQGT